MQWFRLGLVWVLPYTMKHLYTTGLRGFQRCLGLYSKGILKRVLLSMFRHIFLSDLILCHKVRIMRCHVRHSTPILSNFRTRRNIISTTRLSKNSGSGQMLLLHGMICHRRVFNGKGRRATNTFCRRNVVTVKGFPNNALCFSRICQTLICTNNRIKETKVKRCLKRNRPLFIFQRMTNSNRTTIRISILKVANITNLSRFLNSSTRTTLRGLANMPNNTVTFSNVYVGTTSRMSIFYFRCFIFFHTVVWVK